MVIMQPKIRYYTVQGVTDPSIMLGEFLSVELLSPNTCNLVLSVMLKPTWQGSLALNYSLFTPNSAFIITVVHSELHLPKFVATLSVSSTIVLSVIIYGCLQISPLNPMLRLVYNKRYAEKDSKYEVACNTTLTSITPTFSYERKLSRYSRIGVGLTFSYPACSLLAKFR